MITDADYTAMREQEVEGIFDMMLWKFNEDQFAKWIDRQAWITSSTDTQSIAESYHRYLTQVK